MINVGLFNQLTVTESLPFSFVLSEQSDDRKVLLSTLKAPKGTKVGQQLSVFVAYDEDGNLTAQTAKPLIELNQTKLLKAVGVTDFAAFFAWGIERDLMVATRDQERPVAEGLEYMVHLYHDAESKRLLGSTRLHYFYPEKVSNEDPIKVNQKVDLIAYAKTDLGYKVMINHQFLGLLFSSDVLSPPTIGKSFSGFIKHIRNDGKIDVCMQIDNSQHRRTLEQLILDDLEAHGGLSSITDKSTPDEIYAHFNVSKGAYKKAIGNLYRQKRIMVSKQSIRLVKVG